MKTVWGGVLALFCVIAAEARTVEVDTVAANPGATVAVGVKVDSLEGVGAATIVIGYDPTVVVPLGVDAGRVADDGKMTYADTGSGRIVAVFSGFADGEGGELMRIRFSVRDSTQGLFSDVTLQDVQFGARDGVSDLSVENPVTVKNGMIRSVAKDAELARLEAPFTLWQKTTLKTLSLGAGDGIQAADDGRAVCVSGAVSVSGAVQVRPPLHGWRTGRYAILSTPTSGLVFAFDGLTNDVAVSVETSGGVVTYYADVRLDGQFDIVSETGELDITAKARLGEQLEGLLASYPEVSRVVIRGEVALAALIADLGIHPRLTVSGSEASAEYRLPRLEIIGFEPKTGHVRIKVTPGEGNKIENVLSSGCVHVYGTERLGEKMRYLSGTAFDLTDYLKQETPGEADLIVSMGSCTFIKVKIESSTKQEGDTE
jgi:hypothetical protein